MRVIELGMTHSGPGLKSPRGVPGPGPPSPGRLERAQPREGLRKDADKAWRAAGTSRASSAFPPRRGLACKEEGVCEAGAGCFLSSERPGRR